MFFEQSLKQAFEFGGQDKGQVVRNHGDEVISAEAGPNLYVVDDRRHIATKTREPEKAILIYVLEVIFRVNLGYNYRGLS